MRFNCRYTRLDGCYTASLCLHGVKVSLLAVEMDTYKNPFDPDTNHIGLDTTSAESVATKCMFGWKKCLSSAGINLKSGRPIKVQIYYDGLTKMLYVYMAYSGDQLQKSMEKPIIMSETVPSSVYVGFTAATGELSESHQLLDWTFTTFPLPSYSPRKQYLLIMIAATKINIVGLLCKMCTCVEMIFVLYMYGFYKRIKIPPHNFHLAINGYD
ncbi:hypothetical protein CISIN_1g036537mg, partial [Citrus sinensis]